MWDNRITRLLGIRYPIIQGGLAHLAFSELAAAVSEAGGLGQIGTVASFPDPEALRADIQAARRLTRAPIGVNFSIGRNRSWKEFMDVTIQEKVEAISITGGDPNPMLEYSASHGMVRMVVVSSVRQAQRAERLGADLLIAVGMEGGGHVGVEDTTTLTLIPSIVDAVQIPVVASGGIGDARGVLAALALGAEGVQMGTRFIATQECRAHERYKQMLVECQAIDTIVIERSIGRAGRVLRTAWVERVQEAERANVGLDGLLPLISGAVNKRAALDGDFVDGFVWAGQSTAVIRDVPPVGQLMERIVGEITERLAAMNQQMGPRP